MRPRLFAAGLFGLTVLLGSARADAPKAQAPEKRTLPTGRLDTEDWLKEPVVPLKAGEIDRLVAEALDRAKVEPVPLTTDEQFLRRATLDLTGRLPTPEAIRAFLADQSADKRARVIDRLLESDAYATHWALYWRNVIQVRTTDFRARAFARAFDKWMTEQLKANKSWGEIARSMLTADGEIRFAEADKNGQAYFLLSRSGADATTERAAETSRIFLGIQIQCAQCHDHPSDVWQRHHFHEFAAFYGRLRDRFIFEEKKIAGARLTSLPFGEYRMPDADQPRKTTVTYPKFLDGKSPGARLNDTARRRALARAVTAKDNPWFAAAFVNRVWGELMGQAFYMPIDDLGPQKEAVMPEVIARVSAGFRATDYDVKRLFRDLMTSTTYQRQLRPGESREDHLLFAAHNPTRLNGDALWRSLTGALGPVGGGFGGGRRFGGGGFGRFGRFQPLELLVKQEFAYDPSTRPEEVEGSVSQALLLMNNPALNQRLRAGGSTVLARVLETYSKDDEALRALYLRVLARRPTDRELARCRDHVAAVGNRAEAFEDVLWALINSTEFQTKR